MDLVAGKAYPVERRPIRHVDPVLLVAVVALATVGLVAIYSSTHQSLEAIGSDQGFFVKRQLSFLAKAELFDIPLFGRFIRAVNARP